MNYDESVKFIETFANLDQVLFTNGTKDAMSPTKMLELLEILGYSSSLNGLIHITGTKGKGSTAAFIASALNNLNGPANLFICPHLHSYTERFRLGNIPTSKESFAKAVCQVKEKIESSDISRSFKIAQFYIIICAFIELSKSIKPNWHVVEVGLGGKNDPTSALTNKKVAVFTSIHKEHSEFLGHTIGDITHNKAGIITKGCQVIVSQQENMEVVDILKSEALKKQCDFIYVPENYRSTDISVVANRQKLTIEGPYGKSPIVLSMLGKHQAMNAMTAMAVINSLGFHSSKKINSTICKSFEETKLPGRFEVLDSNPLTILDGAHTKESARLLWTSVNEYCKYERAIVIVAIGKDKEAQPLVTELCKNASIIITTNTSHPKALPASKLKTIACQVSDKPVESRNSVKEALQYAKKISCGNDLILITGSLYTANDFIVTSR